MGSRIVGIIVLVVLLIGAYYIWQHYTPQKHMDDGSVSCVGCMTPTEKARFDKENSGDVIDGQSEHKIRTSREEDALGNPEGAAAAGQTVTPEPRPGDPFARPTPTAPYYPPSQSSQPAAAPGTYGLDARQTPERGDTQPPNAPNGYRFAGSGTYQWYRQGNLTWRIDTVSGGTCVAFATMDEWRKPVVYRNGCGRGI